MVNAIAPPDVRIVGPHFNVDQFLLLPFIPPPPPRHDWDVECYFHLAAFIVGLARP